MAVSQLATLFLCASLGAAQGEVAEPKAQTAKAYREAGQIEKALAVCDELVLARGHDDACFQAALREKTECLLAGGRFREAAAIAAVYYASSPASPEVTGTLLTALRARDGHLVGANRFVQFARFGPGGPDGKAGTPDDLTSPASGVRSADPAQEAKLSALMKRVPQTGPRLRTRGRLALCLGRPDLALQEFRAQFVGCPNTSAALCAAATDIAIAVKALDCDGFAAREFLHYQATGAPPDRGPAWLKTLRSAKPRSGAEIVKFRAWAKREAARSPWFRGGPSGPTARQRTSEIALERPRALPSRLEIQELVTKPTSPGRRELVEQLDEALLARFTAKAKSNAKQAYYAHARKQYENVIDLLPDTGHARSATREVLKLFVTESGSTSTGLETFRVWTRARLDRPEGVYGQYLIARTWFLAGYHSYALKEVGQFLKEHPRSRWAADAELLLALKDAQGFDFDKAIARIRQIVQARPKTAARAKLRCAGACLEILAGRPEAARKALQQADSAADAGIAAKAKTALEVLESRSFRLQRLSKEPMFYNGRMQERAPGASEVTARVAAACLALAKDEDAAGHRERAWFLCSLVSRVGYYSEAGPGARTLLSTWSSQLATDAATEAAVVARLAALQKGGKGKLVEAIRSAVEEYVASRDYRAATQLCTLVKEKYPDSELHCYATYRAATCSLLQGGPATASQTLSSLLESAPKSPCSLKARTMVGAIAFSQSQYESAVTNVAAAADELTRTKDRRLAAHARLVLALARDAQSSWCAALADLQSICDRDGETPYAPVARQLIIKMGHELITRLSQLED